MPWAERPRTRRPACRPAHVAARDPPRPRHRHQRRTHLQQRAALSSAQEAICERWSRSSAPAAAALQQRFHVRGRGFARRHSRYRRQQTALSGALRKTTSSLSWPVPPPPPPSAAHLPRISPHGAKASPDSESGEVMRGSRARMGLPAPPAMRAPQCVERWLLACVRWCAWASDWCHTLHHDSSRSSKPMPPLAPPAHPRRPAGLQQVGMQQQICQRPLRHRPAVPLLVPGHGAEAIQTVAKACMCWRPSSAAPRTALVGGSSTRRQHPWAAAPNMPAGGPAHAAARAPCRPQRHRRERAPASQACKQTAQPRAPRQQHARGGRTWRCVRGADLIWQQRAHVQRAQRVLQQRLHMHGRGCAPRRKGTCVSRLPWATGMWRFLHGRHGRRGGGRGRLALRTAGHRVGGNRLKDVTGARLRLRLRLCARPAGRAPRPSALALASATGLVAVGLVAGGSAEAWRLRAEPLSELVVNRTIAGKPMSSGAAGRRGGSPRILANQLTTFWKERLDLGISYARSCSDSHCQSRKSYAIHHSGLATERICYYEFSQYII